MSLCPCWAYTSALRLPGFAGRLTRNIRQQERNMIPNIFVSSTIDDLHHLRDALRDTEAPVQTVSA